MVNTEKTIPKKEITKKRVVILSSDATLGLSLSLFFENTYKVISTSEDEMVIAAIDSHMVDLLIIDVGIFDTGILELINTIRMKNKEIPIVVMYVFQEKLRQFEDNLRPDVNMIFYKPVDLTQVSSEVRMLLAG